MSEYSKLVKENYKPRQDPRKVMNLDKSMDVNSSNLFINPKSSLNKRDQILRGNQLMEEGKKKRKKMT